MCGIFCSISQRGYVDPPEDLQRRLHQRGPDSQQTLRWRHSLLYITVLATVLSLRGSKVVGQPLADESGDYVFAWNGEAWSIDGRVQTGNDTALVFELLKDAVKDFGGDRSDGRGKDDEVIASALSRIAGPFAFIFYDRPRSRLYLGRDFLGRRSLMARSTNGGSDIEICSVSDGSDTEPWNEVASKEVHCMHLQDAPSHDVFGNPTTKLDIDVSVIPMRLVNDDPLTTESPSVARLEDLLRASLSLRVVGIPEPPLLSTEPEHALQRAKLAILFSGGLDCTVLARLLHDLFPANEPVDLLNVAFENPRTHKSAEGDPSASYELCPDRITGRKSYAELLTTCPDRDWRFVVINVPYTESQQNRPTVISLMSPHNTEMDISISLALYFAARGHGHVQCPDSSEEASMPYTTSARVLLSGLGADELFGGYTRHATAFRNGGMTALLDELELDISRLSTRNLGRDDRVMSHWSREVRFPYLDEKLMDWALAAPVGEKCGFGETEEAGVIEPGKKVLRCLAWKLGMRVVAREKKRAIQFGARTAKMETRKTKGTTVLS